MANVKSGNKVVLSVLGVWLALARSTGASGLTARLRPPSPQAVDMMLTVAPPRVAESVAKTFHDSLQSWTAGL